MRLGFAFIVAVCSFFLLSGAGLAAQLETPSAEQQATVQNESVATCGQLADQLSRQEAFFLTELRQVKRELVMLRQQREKPGLREIVGGIGYIMGLLGVATYVASKKKTRP